MTTTFKLFLPTGDCRRVTFDSVPELAAINELVDGMVEATSDRRQLTYVDSEGDRVVIKTSRDVTEAVHDAREAGAKTIKIYIRPRDRCGANKNGDGSGNKKHPGARRFRAGPWRGRCGRGLFAHPAEVSGEWREIADVIGAIFPGLFVAPSRDTDDASNGHNDNTDEATTSTESTETSTQAEKRTPESAEKSKPASQDPVQSVPGSDPAVNEQVESQVSSDAATVDKDLDAKATLLREMGFEIPLDVARNMISEMGGRMDLIVRALVANQK